MPSAKASGADTTPNGTGNAKSREHNQGNQDRTYTVEQKTAVIRVRRCAATAFYDILGLEAVKKTVSDGEIKKAYRRLSLLTHPDKNAYEGADEAFKMVSRAFQILSDPDKKAKYDTFGGDPDNRFGASAAGGGSPFSGFARSQQGQGRPGPMWEEEISPEEMFNRFFGGGGGMGAAFSPFGGDGGSQFVFNLGGGPGYRVHQFGGGRAGRRPRDGTTTNPATTTHEPAPSFVSAFSNLLPLLILFVLPLLSSFFSDSGSSTASSPGSPSFRFDAPAPPHTLHRTTPRLRLDYYLNPADVHDWTHRRLYQLDQKAEVSYLARLRAECDAELDERQRLVQAAQGWFFQDADLMRRANAMELRSCRRLDDLRTGHGAATGGGGGWF